MRLDFESEVLDEVAAALADCDSPARACNATVSVLNARTGGAADALLVSAGQLAVVACSGAWQAPAAVPTHYGIVGRVLATARTVVIGDASIEYAGVHPGRPVGSVVCAPVPGPAEGAIGVLNLEFDRLVGNLAPWGSGLAQIGSRLGARIGQLGGPPEQSRAERLLRHTIAFGSAANGTELAVHVCQAAVEVAGLASAIMLLRGSPSSPTTGVHVLLAAHTAAGAADLPARVAAFEPSRLSQMIDTVCRLGASHTFGDSGSADTRGFDALVRAGVRTLIAVPIPLGGRMSEVPRLEAALLVMDEAAVRVDVATVSVLELLITNAVMCRERLAALHRLQQLADSDPLTGLRHQGPFTQRLAATRAGRTALLVVDVDNFKQVNDTAGHAAGDRLLVEVAEALRGALRAEDEVFRVGGDEFVAVLDVVDEVQAAATAARLVAAVGERGCAVSVGVAVRRRDESAESALHRADRAMYAAKHDEHERVHVWRDLA
ncbi:hypothetical protein Cs7R123_09640 [Catellatospora sp. TT07R-123]|uniref:GGDEF domain-containing protein n=1 Tax=Catellatospora sp. TT07R-123 TaxID=2733863 RepID=UPI001B1D4284|nr:GGDEF domain-containing protein [Catellatospora sp. TT07R-123]GHJ43622.1 hypothetical protein Cs7R123_09640 [Catellatospora sp. TT07R-123]